MLLQREAQSFDKGASVLFCFSPPLGRILWFVKMREGLFFGGGEGDRGGKSRSVFLQEPVITPALNIILSLILKIAAGLHLE